MVERAIVRKLSPALSNAFTRGDAQTDRLDIAGFSAVLEDVQAKVINPWELVAGRDEEIDMAVKEGSSQCVEMAVEAAEGGDVMLRKTGSYLLEQLIGETGEGCHGRGWLRRVVMAI